MTTLNRSFFSFPLLHAACETSHRKCHPSYIKSTMDEHE